MGLGRHIAVSLFRLKVSVLQVQPGQYLDYHPTIDFFALNCRRDTPA
jgi:hypothetical protein